MREDCAGPWPLTGSQRWTRRSFIWRTRLPHARRPVYDLRGRPPPTYEELLEHVERRLSLVPRFRQKLRFVPLNQGRPVWVDDPHFNLEYHVRATALPPPGSEEQLKYLASRVFAQQLDRTKPLWEIWLVAGPRTAARRRRRRRRGGAVRAAFQDPPRARRRRRRRRHHRGAVRHRRRARDTARPGTPWQPRPEPTSAQLLGDALIERATQPAEVVRSARAAFRAPRRIARRGLEAGGHGRAGQDRLGAPRRRSLNVDIGPHRRFDWVRDRPERRQGDQEPARRHRQRRRAGGRDRCAAGLPAAARREPSTADAEGDGAGQRAARERVRDDRQPRRGDDGAAAGLRGRPGRAPADPERGAVRPEGLRPGGRRRGAHPAGRLRAADGAGAGEPPAVAAALLQPGRDERARPADASCTCSAAR